MPRYLILLRNTWRHHHMETFSTSLALCEGNPPLVTGGFPSQGASIVQLWFSLCCQSLNKKLNKQLSCWWFAMPWFANNFISTNKVNRLTFGRMAQTRKMTQTAHLIPALWYLNERQITSSLHNRVRSYKCWSACNTRNQLISRHCMDLTQYTAIKPLI